MYWVVFRSCKCHNIIQDPLHSDDGKLLSWGSFYGVYGKLFNILSRNLVLFFCIFIENATRLPHLKKKNILQELLKEQAGLFEPARQTSR